MISDAAAGRHRRSYYDCQPRYETLSEESYVRQNVGRRAMQAARHAVVFIACCHDGVQGRHVLRHRQNAS